MTTSKYSFVTPNNLEGYMTKADLIAALGKWLEEYTKSAHSISASEELLGDSHYLIDVTYHFLKSLTNRSI